MENIRMEMRKIFNEMSITCDDREWTMLLQRYLELKKQLKKN
jgi:hypothetical protein